MAEREDGGEAPEGAPHSKGAAAKKHDGKHDGKKGPLGLPSWALLPMVVAVLIVGLLWYRSRSGKASTTTSGTDTSTPNYAAGIANDEYSALASQLQGLQGSVGNLTPQATDQTWTPWRVGGTESINDMAAVSMSTPAAIIQHLKDAAGPNGMDPELMQYIDAGHYETPLPAGATILVPVSTQENKAITASGGPAIGTGNPPVGSITPIHR